VKRLLIVLLLLLATAAQAQTRVPRLGFLVQEMGRAQSQALKGVSAELKKLGYQERKNFSLETRNAKGDRSALQASAKELADKKVEVIFTTGTRATMAAISASQDIPIVFVHPGDPVAVGIMKGAADSPRNVTGVAAYAAETTEKRLALFKAILPSLTKIHVFFDANSNFSRNNFALAEAAAKKLSVQIIGHGVKSTDELKTTLGNLNNEPGAAIFQVTDDLVESEAEYVFATARQKKMPTVFNEEVWAINGATVTYGPSYLDMGRLAAHSIAEIFKGKAPAALPIVRASKFDLTINYRGAKFIDLVLPNNIVKKADKVIR
jgi:putative tryptophan/tyrosine transport system substrate-binding protein